MKKFFPLLFGFLFVFAMASCSSGGGSGGNSNNGDSGDGTGDSSGDTDTDGATAEEVETARSLASLPSLDVSSYDLTVSASGNITPLVSSLIKNSFMPEGSFSTAGCEAYRHQNEIIRMSREIESMQCMVVTGDELDLFDIPSDNTFAYYTWTPAFGEDEGEGGGEGGDWGDDSGGGSSAGGPGGEGSGDGEGQPTCNTTADCQTLVSNGVCSDGICSFTCTVDADCNELAELTSQAMACYSGNCGPAGGSPAVVKRVESEYEIKARMGLFCEDSSGTAIDFAADGSCPVPGTLKFKMDIGMNGELAMEARFAVIGSRYVGNIVSAFQGGHGGMTETSEINIDINTTPEGDFDFTSASIAGTFNGDFGNGTLSFEADAAALTNTVQAGFASAFSDDLGNSLTNTATVASVWSGTSGCGLYSGSGEYPSMLCPYETWVSEEFQGQPCCMQPSESGETLEFVSLSNSGNCEFSWEDTEPYTITLAEDGTPIDWLVSATNSHCTAVAALGALETPTIGFEGDGSWLDTATFTEVDTSSAGSDVFSPCFQNMTNAQNGGEYSICMQDFASSATSESRAESSSGGEGGGEDGSEPTTITMTLDVQNNCEGNPMPDTIYLFLDQTDDSPEFFGIDADTNGDGVTEPVGGGMLENQELVDDTNSFDSNMGSFDDAHYDCEGTVDSMTITVTNCEDGCSFSYTAAE